MFRVLVVDFVILGFIGVLQFLVCGSVVAFVVGWLFRFCCVSLLCLNAFYCLWCLLILMCFC